MIIVPALDDFHTKYPDIELTLGMSDRRVDIIEEGVDCAIRVGSMVDSNMVARRLGKFHFVTAATPSYLKKYGVPQTIDELDSHVAVKYISARTGRPGELHFLVDGHDVEVKIPAKFTVNDAEAHLAVGLKGMGLIQIARMLALPHLHRVELLEVLPQCKPAPMETSIVYPQNRHRPSALRAFVDWILLLCADHPLLEGPRE